MGFFDNVMNVPNGLLQNIPGFKEAGNVLFGGNADPAKYKAPTLTAGTQGAISDVDNQANRSSEDLQKELMSGVAGTGQGLLPTAQSIGNREDALGMTSSQSQKDALGARNQRIYNQELNSLQREAPLEAAKMRTERLEKSHQVLAARDKWNLGVAGEEIKSLLNENASRMAVVGEVIGAVGTVLGGVMGGAAGAKMGSKAGGGFDVPSGQSSGYTGE